MSHDSDPGGIRTRLQIPPRVTKQVIEEKTHVRDAARNDGIPPRGPLIDGFIRPARRRNCGRSTWKRQGRYEKSTVSTAIVPTASAKPVTEKSYWVTPC